MTDTKKNKTSASSNFPHDIHTYQPYHVDVEVYDRASENPAHKYSLKTTDEKYAVISEDEKFIFELMDGTRNLDEIALLFMEEKGRISLTMIQNLTLRLWQEGILTDPDRSTTTETAQENNSHFQLTIPGLNQVGSIFYPLFGLILINPISTFIMIVLGIYGTTILSDVYSQAGQAKPLFTYNNNATTGLAMMALAIFSAAIVRFIGLSMAHRKNKIKITHAGLIYSHGFLGLFTTAPGITTLKSGTRFWLRISGLVMVFAISGIFFTISKHANISTESSLLLFQFGFYLLLYCLFQCCPLINSDLYSATADYLDEKFLRRSSINFVTGHIKNFFKPSAQNNSDNVTYIMFSAAILLWIAGTAQLLLSAISQNSAILSGLFNKDQAASTFILLAILVLPILSAFTVCSYWLYRLSVKTISSISFFQTSRNMVIFASVVTLLFIILIRIADNDTRKIIYLLLILSTSSMTILHAFKASRLQKKSPYKTQFIALTIFALTFIALCFTNLFILNSPLSWILTLILAISLLGFSLMNIPIDWNEFISQKRDSYITSISLIVVTACLWVINDRILKNSLNNIVLSEAYSADYLSLSKTTGIMTFLILGISLVLNIPALIQQRKTEKFSSFFVIVFATHFALYFSILHLMGLQDIAIWESITTTAILLLIGTETYKITYLNQHKEISSFPLSSTENEKQSLIHGFQYLIDNIFNSIEIDFGPSRTAHIKRKFNAYSQTMQWNWDIDKIPQDETNINTMGEIYKNAFQKIRQISYQTCGLHYIDKLLNEIDDNLHPLAKVVINTRVTQLSTSKNLDTQRNLSTTEKRELIKSIVLFNDLKEDHISQLISCLHSHTYSEGERIIKQYAEGDRLYIIVEGKAQVEVENMAGQSQIVSYLTDNDFFGEIALLTSSERTASIRACTSTTVLYLKRKDFDAFLDLNPGDKEKIIESLNRLRLIKNIPLFRDLDSTLINTFTSQMVQSKFKLNDQIITQGEIGDQFYIILNGECRVHVDRDDKKDHQVAQLSTGEYFGEIALLKDIPRTASVSANSESVTVLTLKKQNFLEAIESHKTLISDFNTASNRRIVEMMH